MIAPKHAGNVLSGAIPRQLITFCCRAGGVHHRSCSGNPRPPQQARGQAALPILLPGPCESLQSFHSQPFTSDFCLHPSPQQRQAQHSFPSFMPVFKRQKNCLAANVPFQPSAKVCFSVFYQAVLVTELTRSDEGNSLCALHAKEYLHHHEHVCLTEFVF